VPDTQDVVQQLRSGSFDLGGCLVDPQRGRVIHGDGAIRVEPKVMDLLLLLCSRPGEVVSKDEIFHSVWKDAFVTDHVLSHAIWQVRRALRNPRLVESIPKRGYRLAAEVQLKERRLKVEPEATGRDRRPAIAVLPLANLAAAPLQEYFTDGMTEALISRLAQIKNVRVISRTSVMHYKNRPKPVIEIGAELNVDTVVEGSVYRSGDRVRISAQLIDARTDTHLWAGSYERELADVFELQRELADAIARNVSRTLEVDPCREPSRPVNPEAYEAYLHGRFCWFQFSAGSLDAALSYFQLATQLDPEFSQPWSGISQVWFARENRGMVRPSEAVPHARSAAERALAYDGETAEAHASLGLVNFHFDWDWPAAETQFRKAIQLDPGDPASRIFLADVLCSMGRADEGLEHIRFGLQLDPLNPATRCFLGWLLLFSRQTEQAVVELQRVIDADPGFGAAHQGMWGALYLQQDWTGALREARAFYSIRGEGDLIPFEPERTTEPGYREAMLHVANQLSARSQSTYVPNLRIARMYAHANQINSAFDWLQRAYDERESPLIHLAVAWDWDNMKDDPRFTRLLNRIGLPAPCGIALAGRSEARVQAK
jgi:TolB-like protein